jgi:aryl-alcohol dehydrogenase-like predicted oxidoreductase
MEYRRLGASGIKVSLLGLGGNNFGPRIDADRTRQVIEAAQDEGVTFFDTADTYGEGRSEEYLGRALGARRGEVVIATKVGGGRMGPVPNDRGTSRQHIMDGVHASLRRLGTDHIDLLQMHVWDPETPLEETLGALDDLVRSGKVRYIGCSNYTAWQLTWALGMSERHGWSKFISVQPNYSLVHRDPERELIPACREFGIGVIPYYPLGGGVLTGKYREGEPAPTGTRGAQSERFFQRFATPQNLAIIRRLESWAREREHTIAELAIAWLAAQPTVSTVIAGATRLEQVRENAKGAAWRLTPEEVSDVAGLTGTRPA